MSICLFACNSVKIILACKKTNHYALYSSRYLYCVIVSGFTNYVLARTGIVALHYASQYPAFKVSVLPSDLSFQVYNVSFDLISKSITCINYRIIVKWKGCANTLP
jgi:hypothetical protein